MTKTPNRHCGVKRGQIRGQFISFIRYHLNPDLKNTSHQLQKSWATYADLTSHIIEGLYSKNIPLELYSIYKYIFIVGERWMPPGSLIQLETQGVAT